jgi:hypothetical protein
MDKDKDKGDNTRDMWACSRATKADSNIVRGAEFATWDQNCGSADDDGLGTVDSGTRLWQIGMPHQLRVFNMPDRLKAYFKKRGKNGFRCYTVLDNQTQQFL